MNINNVNTCVSLYRVTVAEAWNSLTTLEKKTNRNCATHGVVLVILVERMTSAIATSARITSAYFRAYNRVHCYCSGITIYYIIDCTCVYRVSLLVNWRSVVVIICGQTEVVASFSLERAIALQL